jgi:para-nitrobenzyl esterase
MMKNLFLLLLMVVFFVPMAQGQAKKTPAPAAARKAPAGSAPQVKTVHGVVAGITEKSGVRAFKGIPFAAPPVGNLRWREPQPVQPWTGVRRADKFGPRPMQRSLFGDMNFRSNGMSEDCLYLNVWMPPAKAGQQGLPVLVYFYGGGLMAGDGSEPRYDGENMARQGIIAITVNYRLTVFGFLSHPELTQESPHQASGNYGYLDQQAALRWVQQNIRAFGGDPMKITIAGESAGSSSVNAQMASPLAKDLIAGAIGESGSLMGTTKPVPLSEGEQVGLKFASSIQASSLTMLRALPAAQLLEATASFQSRFPVTVDGYFLTKQPVEIFAAGQQAQVPLLVGWNSEEANYKAILGQEPPTRENYLKALQKLYGDKAEQVLKLYPATTEEEVMQAATDLAGDRFIGFSTWKWGEVHGKTGGKPVYRYLYARPRPPMRPEMGNAVPGLAGGVITGPAAEGARMPPARGAVHSAEIEYALGNLATNKVYAWTPEDYKLSEKMMAYFANFIKTGNPNGPGLPSWPAANAGSGVQVMVLDEKIRAEPERHPARYQFLDQLMLK